LAVVLALKAQGCQNIIVSEVSTQRRKFAKQFGAHHVIDPSSHSLVEEVKGLTKGFGADVGFDACGIQAALDTAIKSVRARGTLVNIALWGSRRPSLDSMDMIFGERKWQAGMLTPMCRCDRTAC
jgi:threonine dehydrogenase-like Zn-dependent dehydrogenase